MVEVRDEFESAFDGDQGYIMDLVPFLCHGRDHGEDVDGDRLLGAQRADADRIEVDQAIKD